jgi:cytochrome P450
VHRATAPDGRSIWLVTRYADVRAALADPRLSLEHASGGYRGFSAARSRRPRRCASCTATCST